MPAPSSRARAVFVVVAAMFLLLVDARPASAIPAFARRYAASCRTCHEYHYPRLNSYGDRFRMNGYQLPDGAEDPARARRMIEPGTVAEGLSIFREPPLSLRAQVVASGDRTDAHGLPEYQNRVASFLAGGGSVARDVSFFFSWTPFGSPGLHHARLGLHNLGASVLGEGTLNLKAGALLLLDAQRPVHRSLAPGGSPAGSVAVGLNPFMLDESMLGVALYGRPGWGAFAYELALVAGAPGSIADADEWKDLFARVTWTFFQDTDHELDASGFGYLGRADIVTDVGGVVLAQRDDFWLAGGDVEADLGPFTVTALGYLSHHGDPSPEGGAVDFWAARAEAIWGLGPRLVTSLDVQTVQSHDDHSLARTEGQAHLTYLLATNVLATAAWRHDLESPERFMATAVLETTF